VLFASGGHALLVPVQVSVTSQTPADERQTAPALPAGCWQKSLDPLQVSVVHGFPSSVQAVPFGSLASGGQGALVPVQFSVRSHSPPEARHTVVEDLKTSVGHVLLVPVQTSATSQMPAEERHGLPALPAGCCLASCVPSQVSVVHGLPSSVHAVPFDFFASAGQVAPLPVQFSVRSHSSTERRQVTVEDLNASFGHDWPAVPVQSSATSQMPADARQTKVLDWVVAGGHVALDPVHDFDGSQTSPEPA
jgi:hypothetical protein